MFSLLLKDLISDFYLDTFLVVKLFKYVSKKATSQFENIRM